MFIIIPVSQSEITILGDSHVRRFQILFNENWIFTNSKSFELSFHGLSGATINNLKSYVKIYCKTLFPRNYIYFNYCYQWQISWQFNQIKLCCSALIQL